MPKLGRNDPCPCGSGKKYKKCCLAEEQDEVSRQLREEGERERRVAQEYRTLESSDKAFQRFHDDLLSRHAKDPAARLAALAERAAQPGLDAVWAERLADLFGDIGCSQPDLASGALAALDRMQALNPDACDQGQSRPAGQAARAELSLFVPQADLPAAVGALIDGGDLFTLLRLFPAVLYHERLAGMAEAIEAAGRRLQGEEPGLSVWAARFRLAELLVDPAAATGPEAIPAPGFEAYPEYAADLHAALRGELSPDSAFGLSALSDAELSRLVTRATIRFAFDQHRQGLLGPGRSLLVEHNLYRILLGHNRPEAADGPRTSAGSPWLPPAEDLDHWLVEAPWATPHAKAATCMALPAWVAQAESSGLISAAHASRARARLPDLARAIGEEVTATVYDGTLERDLRDFLDGLSSRAGDRRSGRQTRTAKRP